MPLPPAYAFLAKGKTPYMHGLLRYVAITAPRSGMKASAFLLHKSDSLDVAFYCVQQGTDKAQLACEEVLQRLRIDYVDLVLIHWPGVAKLEV